MSIKVRFAPSPTGPIHLGNIYIATINWLFAKKNNGTFLLRFDDTDLERSRNEFIEQIKQDLLWLDLTWDECIKQSDNFSIYHNVKNILIESGRLYPCYDSVEDLDIQRQSLLSQGKPPVYDRRSLNLSEAEKVALEEGGIKPHWRFKLDHKVVSWKDLTKGKISYDASCISDPVLIRSDGYPLYTLTSVIDDINYGITHIIRGEDHITNTVSQIQLFEALGSKAPEFAHLPMLVDSNKSPLSKRNMEDSFNYIKNQGWENLSIINILTRNSTFGTAPVFGTFDQIINNFNLSAMGKSAISIDNSMINQINPKVLAKMPYSLAIERLSQISELCNENFWNVICSNIDKFSDVNYWYNIISGNLENKNLSNFDDEDKNIALIALNNLPNNNFDDNLFNFWIEQIKQQTGAENRKLYRVLYLSLAGKENGPNLCELLKLIDIKTIRNYLRNFNGN